MERRAGSWWTPAFLGLLLVLLLALAALQLRWLDALRASEAARLASFLSTGVDRVALDLERDLLRVESAFRGVDASTEAELERALLARLRALRADAEAPGLVRTVLWLDPGAPERPRVVDLEADALRAAAWTPELAPWARAAAELATAERVALPADPPGVAVPVLGPAPGRLSFVVALLDAGSLRERRLPQLARRHLGQPLAPPVDVLVLRGDEVAYRSRPELERADLGAADARRRVGGGAVVVAGDGDGLTVRTRRAGGAGELLELEEQRASGEPGGAAATRLVLAVPSWEVRARHAAGSVARAAEALRDRNLALGLGVLAVLAAAGALLALAARRARRLARRQVEFVAGVTHELRTPLTVIRSAAENLADRVVARPDQVRRYGELIHDEAVRLSELVERALALAGAGAGGGPERERREAVDLAALARGVVERCAAAAGRPAEAVRLDVPDDAPRVLADRALLEGALANLVDNALAHAGPDAEVGVRAASGRRGRVDVTVWDRGPGIPRDERGRLFEPFFRGRRAREARVPGSGLGLCVVRRSVEALGGDVSVESDAGAGAAFTLHLPAAEAGSA